MRTTLCTGLVIFNYFVFNVMNFSLYICWTYILTKLFQKIQAKQRICCTKSVFSWPSFSTSQVSQTNTGEAKNFVYNSHGIFKESVKILFSKKKQDFQVTLIQTCEKLSSSTKMTFTTYRLVPLVSLELYHYGAFQRSVLATLHYLNTPS